MIRKVGEGERARNGLNIHVTRGGGLSALSLVLTRRVQFWLYMKPFRGFRTFLDTRRDHSMYRPSDMDLPSLVCRRCGDYSWMGMESYCDGWVVSWPRGRAEK